MIGESHCRETERVHLAKLNLGAHRATPLSSLAEPLVTPTPPSFRGFVGMESYRSYLFVAGFCHLAKWLIRVAACGGIFFSFKAE